MHLLTFLVAAILTPSVSVLSLPVSQLLPAKPAVQHVTFEATVAGSGPRRTLSLAVTPKARIHVYGPGAKDFVQPSLEIVTPGVVVAGQAAFPRPEIVLDPILEERVPMYTKTFRVSRTATFAAPLKPGETLTVEGLFRYQACDDRMCYPPAVAPVSWVVR